MTRTRMSRARCYNIYCEKSFLLYTTTPVLTLTPTLDNPLCFHLDARDVCTHVPDMYTRVHTFTRAMILMSPNDSGREAGLPEEDEKPIFFFFFSRDQR